MKIPVWAASILLSAMVGGEAWTIGAIIQLKSDVAVIRSSLTPFNQKDNVAGNESAGQK